MTTHTVKLNLPEALYQRLKQRSQQSRRSLEDELLDLLVAKIPTLKTSQSPPLAYDEVINFLGRGTTAKEIAEFRLSLTAQARAQSLLKKSKTESLTPVEDAELELYIELEDFMALIKIKAHQQLQNLS